MVLNYIRRFSSEMNGSNECLLRERRVVLWLPWGRSKLWGEVLYDELWHTRDLPHQALSHSLYKEGQSARMSGEPPGMREISEA